MGFASPEWLWALIAVPVLGIAVAFWHRRDLHRRRAYGDPVLLDRMRPRGPMRATLRTAMVLGALTLVLVSLARPTAGREWQTAAGEGVDICFALDVSNSMRASDVPGAVSRLDAAVSICRQVISNLQFDRFAIVTFTDSAATTCPMTTDMGAALTMLDGVDFGTVGEGGTSLARAISEACDRFDPKEQTGRLIVVLSDGEDHEQGIDAAVQQAKELSAVVHAVGVGSESGSPIPEGDGFLSRNKTYQGRTVVSRLEEATLKQVAAETGGTYLRGSDPHVAERLIDTVHKTASRGSVVLTVSSSREVFQWPLALALVLLSGEMLLPSNLAAGRCRR